MAGRKDGVSKKDTPEELGQALIRVLMTPRNGASGNFHLHDRVRALIEQGADLTATDAAGLTPLMWASGNCRMKILHTLIAAGADPYARDDEGRTAFDHALLKKQKPALPALRAAQAAWGAHELKIGLREPLAVKKPLKLKKKRTAPAP